MTATVEHANAHLDDRDRAALADHVARLAAHAGPRVGDFLRFADGTERRISHLWDAYEHDGILRPATAQTSDGGSWHLGDGYVSFSGGLHPGVPLDTLTDTGETKLGRVWIWHHGRACAHNGVDALVAFRVFTSTQPAT